MIKYSNGYNAIALSNDPYCLFTLFIIAMIYLFAIALYPPDKEYIGIGYPNHCNISPTFLVLSFTICKIPTTIGPIIPKMK